MFTLQQLTQIRDALEMAQRSNKRAMNTTKVPEFEPLYEKIDQDITTTQVIVKNAILEYGKPTNKITK